jgi:hypothetical protein
VEVRVFSAAPASPRLIPSFAFYLARRLVKAASL